MRVWAIFAIAGLGTYLIRASFIVVGSRVTLPPRVERSLRHVGPAVFAAIVAPPVIGTAGVTGIADRVPEVVATVAAGLVAWRTGRVTWVLAVGMLTLWALRALGL